MIGTLVVNISVLTYGNIRALMTGPWVDESEGGFLISSFILQNYLGKKLQPVKFVAVLELVLMSAFSIWIAVNIFRMCRNRTKKDVCWRWQAAAHLFWDVLPELSTCSAMRMLRYVNPQVFLLDLSNELTGVVERKGSQFCVPLLWFLLRRLVALIVGFDAFVVKFSAAADAGSLFNAFAFLNQMLGVVQIARLSRRRLIVYIFGGMDVFMNQREELLQHTWHAMWRTESGSHQGTSGFLSCGS